MGKIHIVALLILFHMFFAICRLMFLLIKILGGQK